MRITLTPAAAVRIGVSVTVLGAALLTAPVSRPARAADAPAAGEARTYDINDFLWYTGDGESGGGATTRKALAEEVVRLVTETVEPEHWKTAGGANTIEERDGRLVVTAGGQVHTLLAEMLRQLRETTPVQGVSLDCHFILADAEFLKRHAPAALGREEPGASVRGIGLLKGRSIVEAARDTPGVVVMPAPPVPLYHLPSTVLLGEERRVRLPRLGPDERAAGKAGAGNGAAGGADATRIDTDKGAAGGSAAKNPGAGDRGTVDVVRPIGFGLTVRAVAGPRYVTLDLIARSGTLDASAGDGASPDALHESEGLFHGTFAVERAGGFLIRAPLVRATLAGVREPAGGGKGSAAGQEVVRAVAAAQSDPPRYLLVVGAVRTMSSGEVTLLAGPVVAKRLEERFAGGDAPAPPPPPGPPGAPPPPPPPPPQQPPNSITRVYDLRSLLLGSERGERAVARAQRLERVMARMQAAVRDKSVRMREQHGQLIVTAMPPQFARISAAIDELTAERLVKPEAEPE